MFGSATPLHRLQPRELLMTLHRQTPADLFLSLGNFESPLSRRTFLTAASAAAAIGWSGLAFAQPKPAKREVEDKTLTALDGAPVNITYYKSSKGKEAPVVILLHQERSNRLVWKNGFPERLNDEGYAVITLDLRKHGAKDEGGVPVKGGAVNLKPADYVAMVVDLEAVKSFLMEEHESGRLNVRKLGILAAGMSGPIALNFAANDWSKRPYDDAPVFAARTPRGQDVRAIVLLSPDENLTGMTSPNAIKALRDPAFRIATFIGVGSKDKQDRRQAMKIHELFTGSEKDTESNLYQKFESNARGTDLFGKKLKVEEIVLAFFKKFVADLPDEWRTRKSKLLT